MGTDVAAAATDVNVAAGRKDNSGKQEQQQQHAGVKKKKEIYLPHLQHVCLCCYGVAAAASCCLQVAGGDVAPVMRKEALCGVGGDGVLLQETETPMNLLHV